MKNNIRKTLSYIILYIGLFLMSATISYLFMYFYTTYKVSDELSDIKELILNDDKNNTLDNDSEYYNETPAEHGQRVYKQLLEQNDDFVGWITIPGTRIDYPVMQTPDNEEYYIYRNFNKQYSGSGSLFCNAAADLERPSENIIIYGHHIKTGTMFNNLSYFKKKEFYDKHKTFTFDTIYRTGTYEIVSVILTDVNPGSYEYWYVSNCNDEIEGEDIFNEYIEFITKKSLYKTDGINDVSYGDKLVTLSTCAYHNENGRLLVIGKLIDSDDISVLN